MSLDDVLLFVKARIRAEYTEIANAIPHGGAKASRLFHQGLLHKPLPAIYELTERGLAVVAGLERNAKECP